MKNRILTDSAAYILHDDGEMEEIVEKILSGIMAGADVFDALVCKRVHKDAMAEEEAFAILREDAGKHFDPVLVDVFFSIREVHCYLVETSCTAI